MPLTTPDVGSIERPGGSVPPSDQVMTAVDELSVAVDGTGLIGAPDTEVWSPGPVATTTLVTTQVKASLAE